MVDASGVPLAVTRMGVRELRAELAARRAPVSGNKKELVKRLQVGHEGGGLHSRGAKSLGSDLQLAGVAGCALAAALVSGATLPPALPCPHPACLPQKLRAQDLARAAMLVERADDVETRGTVRGLRCRRCCFCCCWVPPGCVPRSRLPLRQWQAPQGRLGLRPEPGLSVVAPRACPRAAGGPQGAAPLLAEWARD